MHASELEPKMAVLCSTPPSQVTVILDKLRSSALDRWVAEVVDCAREVQLILLRANVAVDEFDRVANRLVLGNWLK